MLQKSEIDAWSTSLQRTSSSSQNELSEYTGTDIACSYFTAIDVKSESLRTNARGDTKSDLQIVLSDSNSLETKVKSML